MSNHAAVFEPTDGAGRRGEGGSDGGANTSPDLIHDAAHNVGRLLAAGKCKQAVELAKEEHKRWKSPESERLLVDAYLCRIDQFEQKGAVEDARVLLKLVHDRFPAHRGRFAALEARAAAAQGRVDELVAPLARENVTEEVRSAVESAVRRDLIDLAALARCAALSEHHPLRLGAAAAWRAFQAATSGPVTEEQIS